MLDYLDFETLLRLIPFVVILALLVVWELVFPRRAESGRLLRWPSNFGIFLIDVAMLVTLPVSAISAALIAIEYKFGLFLRVEAAFWPKVIFCLIALDLVIYWQHRLFHQFHVLWRVHRMHHTDTAFDVTTALRFHPIEIFLSIFLKAGAIILLGAPVLAVILFEIILNGAAMFNHSNIRMPLWLDRILRWVIVTPDMHRVHHSSHEEEYNHNFGFCLSVWDRLFGSYTSQPKDGHRAMIIGLDEFNTPAEARLDRLISQPFRNHQA